MMCLAGTHEACRAIGGTEAYLNGIYNTVSERSQCSMNALVITITIIITCVRVACVFSWLTRNAIATSHTGVINAVIVWILLCDNGLTSNITQEVCTITQCKQCINAWGTPQADINRIFHPMQNWPTRIVFITPSHLSCSCLVHRM